MSVPAARDHVRDIAVSTADELLAALNPRTGDWGDSATRWIFRGQRDASWKLVPSAMRGTRDDHPFRRVGIAGLPRAPYVTPRSSDWLVRLARLNLMLETFFDALNDQGLVIPVDHPELAIQRRIQGGSFPQRSAFPLMALAQHHGLPTLFLDWTKRAWVAAYFAALDAATALAQRSESGASRAEEVTHLAVWALARNRSRDEEDRQVYFYEPPASTNPNLRAQSGLFTWWLVDGPEDQSLDEYVAWLAQHTEHPPELRRLLLPVAESPRLLRLLALEHIHGASMFPGVDGVVRAMREQTLWDTWTGSGPFTAAAEPTPPL